MELFVYLSDHNENRATTACFIRLKVYIVIGIFILYSVNFKFLIFSLYCICGKNKLTYFHSFLEDFMFE